MIVYKATKKEFCETVLENRIGSVVKNAFRQNMGFDPSPNEAQSFQNSLPYIGNILAASNIPEDVGVAVEYRIPQSSKRIDVIITGRNSDNIPLVIVIELKQWQELRLTTMDAVVRTWVGGKERDVLHPSYQAWSYAQFLRDFSEFVEIHQVQLYPCAYLHNCQNAEDVRSEFYHEHLQRAPVFVAHEASRLRQFIERNVSKGDRGELLYKMDKGKIRPSKALTDHLSSLLAGNQEFTLIDEQKMIFEVGLHLAELASRSQKKVLIVQGGPGTGKSVVAVNLLVELSRRGKIVQYATKNAAPREVFKSKLAGTHKRTRIDSLFKNTGFYYESDKGECDVIVVDEAHRLTEKSGMFKNLGENQVKEIIHAANLSVFFLDESQRVTLHDIGSVDEIVRWAEHFAAEVSEFELPSQFRCNGEDGYIAWLDEILQVRQTANTTLDGINYDFQVFQNPNELCEAISEKNKVRNRSRLVAGYCWDWVSKKNRKLMDICIPEHRFAMQWNLADDGNLWLVKDGAENQIGCIHTCQGLELDYVGVIVGRDFRFSSGRAVTSPEMRSKNDSSIKGFKQRAKKDPIKAARETDLIIKNTYRTLMTRGMKGCYVWAVDEETNNTFRELASRREL
jgi:uncharacterized protein